MIDRLTILNGDALEMLRTLPDESVQCCVTSPPYWGLRDYGMCSCRPARVQHESSTLAGSQAGTPNHVGPACPACPACHGTGRVQGTEDQIGLEKHPGDYVKRLVALFSEVRRVLRADGTLWLNLGDSYAGSGKGPSNAKERPNGSLNDKQLRNGAAPTTWLPVPKRQGARIASVHGEIGHTSGVTPPRGLKSKDLIGIPWRVAFALQEDGWYLRSEITWIKKSCMPESVIDRPTGATEKIFLLSKSERYFYDHEAVKESKAEATIADGRSNDDGERRNRLFPGDASNGGTNLGGANGKRNMRNYWLLGPEPFTDAHFATFPTEIPRRAILAGTPVGGTVLDPFAGSGTTGQVAIELGRKAILVELNPQYVELIERRCDVTPGFAFA
jgi:DNA modification methylase